MQTSFEGVFQQQNPPKNLKRKKLRANKQHLKFPLYLDSEIGFENPPDYCDNDDEDPEFEARRGPEIDQNLHSAVSIFHRFLTKPL